MITTENGINLIKQSESCRLNSYLDSAGIWTIGWGSTMYKSGKKVGKDETITQEQADELLKWEVSNKQASVAAFVRGIKLNRNQFDSLVSFAYNVGTGGLKGSTLLKVIRKNPDDPYIRDCFMMWNKITVNGKKVVSKGLTNRRKKEADLYFKSV